MDLQDKGNGGKNLENGRNFRADVKDGVGAELTTFSFPSQTGQVSGKVFEEVLLTRS